MEGPAADAPLKVCRHCAVASRTEADACPSCGKLYARRWPWRWVVAILIVVLAFGAGYGGRKLLQADDGGPSSITAEQGREVELGISRSELEQSLGEPPALLKSPPVGLADECLYYAITDQPRLVWEFCFDRDELVTSQSVGEPRP